MPENFSLDTVVGTNLHCTHECPRSEEGGRLGVMSCEPCLRGLEMIGLGKNLRGGVKMTVIKYWDCSEEVEFSLSVGL